MILALVLSSQWAIGQLAEKPIQQILPHSTKGKSTARTQSFPPMSLPFWDDFSFRTPGYPDSLWIENASVSISDGVAINPPTLYTATFDGLKADGTPYDPNDLLATGYTDVLSSQLIKMTEVPAPERGTVYLSFFYQWRGNGEAPDANDFLAVEFFDGTSWNEIDRIITNGSLNQSVFYPKIYQVGAAYFHDEFQFRFRSHGKISGPYDTWNIDYVFLAKNRDAGDIFFPDQAANSRLFPLFYRYTAIPIYHFFAVKPAMQTKLTMYNVSDGPDTYSLFLEGKFENWKDSIRTVTVQSLTPLTFGDTVGGVINPLEQLALDSKSLLDPDDPLQFDPMSDSIFVTIKAILNTGDVYDTAGMIADDYDPIKYAPSDFRANDTTNNTYTIKDFYAYDDGIADFSAHLTREGNRLAYQFDMLTDQTDTLIGFRAYFPFYGGQASILDVYVWGDDNGLPGPLLTSRFNITLQKNGENRFMDIFFEPTLVNTKFYVGWEEPANRVYVGLDKNNNTGDKIFVNTNGFWVPNTTVTGSLMIRPIFGSGDIVTGIETEEEPVTLYPNPNNGEFHFDKRSRIITIHDMMGREILFSTEENEEDQFVKIQNPSAGVYLVRSIRNGKVSARKVVVN